MLIAIRLNHIITMGQHMVGLNHMVKDIVVC